ncbi:MAG: flavin reductase family protein [Gemmatimonadota bacterium]|nr:MAG: flavin reductase family protein [Gemmatimonadota bacterium]
MKKSVEVKTIVFPTPVFIVGTYDEESKPNVMTVAWGGLCCSDPPCIALSLRKATYSYGNIVEREAFTVNIPSEAHVKEADYFGITSGRKKDKFSTTGLTPVKSDLVDAPYVKEFPLILECQLLHTLELGLHTQFIGKIMDVKADETVLDEAGLPDIKKVNPIAFSPGNRIYYKIGEFLAQAFSIGREVV